MSGPLLLLVTLALGQADAGYVRTRTPDGLHCLHWPVAAGARTTITFVQSDAGYSPLGPGFLDAVSSSAATWRAQMQSCGNLDLVEGPRSASRLVGYEEHGNNENLVLVRIRDCAFVVPATDPCHASASCGNAYDCWDHGPDILALTTVTAGANDGVVVDADTEVNAVSKFPTLVDSPPCAAGVPSLSCVANDVQSFDTHEFGHFLGLAHAPDPTSTMYYQVPYGDVSRRTLDPGSRQFVCDVYPAGRASNDCSAADTGGSGSGCNASGPPGGLASSLFALALLSLALRRSSGP
ncbi:MAG TPA: myxosortase-dependent metalloprotease, MXAN_2677/MXAN_2678 family [Myxococcaceae bacterium]|nr:myxosortase-dependent metalloprotease, MXAN_2677/MXAN_2678 family [Myxococcaceae bacterium]